MQTSEVIISLSELDRGQSAKVVEMGTTEEHHALAQRLMAMGMLPGFNVKVVAVAPMGDPITVESQGRRISLRLKDAAQIQVILENVVENS